MKLSELREASYNPRVISDTQLLTLKRNLLSLGDLGGIIFNVRSGNLIGGHQRVKAFKEIAPDSELVTEERLEEANFQGTTARGYFVHEGEKFSYREVDWDEQTERIANIAANNVHGSWDVKKLEDLITDLASDVLDLETLSQTGFSQDVLASIVKGTESVEQLLRLDEMGRLGMATPDMLIDPIRSEALTVPPALDEKELDENMATDHTCPKCGYQFS